MIDVVYKCIQAGVNSLNTEYKLGKYLREASILLIYYGGNMGMQRRRVQRIIADENFNPRAVMDDDFIKFDKSMAAIDTVVDPLPRSREIM